MDANIFKIASVEQQEVGGLLTCQIEDRDHEVLDYAASKRYFQEWSENIHAATSKIAGQENASFGNVRLMHGKTTVGKLTRIEFDDAKKQIYGVAKITDAPTWTAIKNGIYSAFSVGAKLVSSVFKNGKRFLTVQPMEVSIVDYPSNPGTTFEFARAAGIVTKFADSTEKQPTQDDYVEAVKKFMEAPRNPRSINGSELRHNLWGDAAAKPVRGDVY